MDDQTDAALEQLAGELGEKDKIIAALRAALRGERVEKLKERSVRIGFQMEHLRRLKAVTDAELRELGE